MPGAVQPDHRPLRGPGQGRPRLGPGVVPRLRLAELRPHGLRPPGQSHPGRGLGPRPGVGRSPHPGRPAFGSAGGSPGGWRWWCAAGAAPRLPGPPPSRGHSRTAFVAPGWRSSPMRAWWPWGHASMPVGPRDRAHLRRAVGPWPKQRSAPPTAASSPTRPPVGPSWPQPGVCAARPVGCGALPRTIDTRLRAPTRFARREPSARREVGQRLVPARPGHQQGPEGHELAGPAHGQRGGEPAARP